MGVDRKSIDVKDIKSILESSEFEKEEDIIELFTNEFMSEDLEPIRIMDEFYVVQGTQFSKEDAYLNPGEIPVYTAATDGPAYYAAENIDGKVMIKGRSLIWSRKGAKAGTIQIFDDAIDKFYISDVSGTIQPKCDSDKLDFIFLKYYIEGQVKKERQSVANNAQLNKSKLENLMIYLPENQKEIGRVIKNILDKIN